MRTHKIGNTTIEYPDEISFCFNPVVINISGYTWAWVEATITDVLTGKEYKEKRALFKTACFFDLSFYIHILFFNLIKQWRQLTICFVLFWMYQIYLVDWFYDTICRHS